MTIEELRQIMHQLKLDFDSKPQLIYVFYETPEGLVNNLSISVQNARQHNRQPLTQQQLLTLMERQYPDAREGRLLAVEHPQKGLSQWMDTTDACRRLHVSRQTLRRWVLKGLLHPAHVGKRRYYDEAEVEALLRSNIVQNNGRLDLKGA